MTMPMEGESMAALVAGMFVKEEFIVN